MRKKKRRNKIRLSVLFIVFALFLFGVMGVRLIQLATSKKIDGYDLQALASNRTMRTETIKASRGTIFSSDKEPLAENVSSYKLIAYLDESRTTNPKKPQHVVDKEKTAKALAPILGISEEEILKYLKKENVYQTEFGSAGKGLTELTKDKIEALNLPGIDFIESLKRYYPKGQFLSYTLGYAKEEVSVEGNQEVVTTKGELGLEAYYNKTLSGEDGHLTYQKDLRGYKIAGTKEEKVDAIDGKDIYLTINSSVQLFVEQALNEAKEKYGYEWFTMMLADAKTGAILASGSNPSFDPNLRNMTSYLDPNTAVAYEPGSTMKIYTYMAAMENNVYNGDETYLSGTYVTQDNTQIRDWNGTGWGTITFDKGFQMSSNVAICNLITRHLNKDILRHYFKKMGFGQKTGITLPNESKGKIDFRYETEILNAGFGQGVLTTPIQNIQALTSLANDGMLLKPYLVEKIVDPDTGEVVYQGKKTEIEKVASTATVNKMKDLMWKTVNEDGNTGVYYRLDGYNLIGKTGTAQIAAEDGSGYLTGESDIISSFAGIYPKDDPKVIIYASVKRPTGGQQNAIWDAVKSVVVNLSKYYGYKHDAVRELSTYQMRSYVNQSTESARNTLANQNLKIQVIGNGSKVIAQYPSKGSKVIEGDQVFLVTNEEKLKIPNLTGYSNKLATALLELLSVKVKTEGTGYVTAQSLPEGTDITKGMEITLTLTPKFEG